MARPRRFARGPRRSSLWLEISPVLTTLTTPGGTITNAANAAILAQRPFTVVRTIMEFQLVSDQAAAVEEQAVAFGMAVVSDQALAIGVTAVPTPGTDAGSDLFFFHKYMFADESNLTDRTKGGSRYSVQSRAMRKVDEDSDIAIVAELQTIGFGARLFSAGRMLIKLH